MEQRTSPTCTGCGRTFGQYRALTTHQRSCKKTNKRASDALGKFQEIIESRKKRRLDVGDEYATPAHLQSHRTTEELVPQTVQVGGLGLRDVRQMQLNAIKGLLILISV